MVLQTKDLLVGNYMNAYPISVLPDVSISEAISFMTRRGIGSIVVEGSKPDYGIFTERDLVYKILNNHIELDEKIEHFSSFPLITAKEGILANEAASRMEANNNKRLALMDQEKITGLLLQEVS